MFRGCIRDYQGCYAVLYCMFGEGGGVNKRLSRMLCCIVLYVWGVHKRLSRMLCCIALFRVVRLGGA